MAVSMAVAVHGHGCGALLERSRRRGGDSIRRYGQRAERRTRLSWEEHKAYNPQKLNPTERIALRPLAQRVEFDQRVIERIA